MDKYQEFILRQVYHYSGNYTEKDIWNKLAYGFCSEKSGRQNCGVFDFDKAVITVNQDEDILSNVYKHTIRKYYYESIAKYKPRGAYAIKRAFFNNSVTENWATDYLSGISVTRDGVNWEELVCDKEEYEIILDFNDRIKKVKFKFVNGLADDYIMDVVYVEGDKEKYYRKKAEEDRRAVIEKAKIKVSTGASLVNVYFAPCSDNYGRTEIELYAEGNLMAKYKVPEEQFFKSIEGLAYGRYSFILKQYGKDGKLIFQTDETPFGIRKPHHGYDADI